MGIEDTLDNNRRFEGRTELSEYMQQAYVKAEKIRAEDRIKMDDFKDLYGADNVEKDILDTLRIVKSFRNNPEQIFAKQTSDVFEILMYTQIELSNWLGSDASTVLTSAYDDVRNGVDMVARFNTDTGPRHLSLAVDVTFGKMKLGEKFSKIQAELNRESRACNVKYYEDEVQKGVLKEIPRSVIGVSLQTVEQLSALWIDGNKDMLGNHPVQFMILEQLEGQLEVFYQYALRKNNQLLASKYKQAYSIVRNVNQEKKASITPSQKKEITALLAQDEIHKLLMQEVELFRDR